MIGKTLNHFKVLDRLNTWTDNSIEEVDGIRFMKMELVAGAKHSLN